MDRAKQFLECYNQLDQYLRQLLGVGYTEPFSQVVKTAATRQAEVRRHLWRLQNFGDLRNAITHQRDRSGQIIAEPTEEALKEFEELVTRILTPPCVLPTFQREIHPYTPEEPLVTALRYMRDYDFSQVVIQTAGKVTLLTSEGIARWLEHQVQDGLILVEQAQIGEALHYELPGGFQIMSRNQTVAEAHEAFAEAIEQGKPRLFAILITQTGKPTEKPVGIITPWDLLNSSKR